MDPETVHDLESTMIAPNKNHPARQHFSEMDADVRSTKPAPLGFYYHFARALGKAAALVSVLFVLVGLPGALWWRGRVGAADEKRCVEMHKGVFLEGGGGLLRQGSYCVAPGSVIEINK